MIKSRLDLYKPTDDIIEEDLEQRVQRVGETTVFQVVLGEQ